MNAHRPSAFSTSGWFLAIIALLLLQAPLAWGQERASEKSVIDRTLDTLFAVHTFPEVSISPDGTYVAWVETHRTGDKDQAAHKAIYGSNLASPSERRRLTAGDGSVYHEEHGLAWSPDGRQLAFLSDADKEGQVQIYVVAGGGKPKKLTNLTGSLTGLRWSPDGSRIGFLFIENAPQALGPLQPAVAETGVIGETVYEQRFAVLTPATGEVRQISPADMHVHEFDWSPDGKNIAAIASHGSGDNNWFIAHLYTLALASGEMKSIYKPAMQIAVPRWSPDGKTIAFIGGLMSDEGVVGGDLFTIPASGGQPHNQTPDRKTSMSWFSWLPASDGILFSELDHGSCGLGKLDLASGRTQALWKGAETASAQNGSFSLSLARDGTISALVRQSFQQPPEVWAGPISAWKQITHSNDKAHALWGEAKDVRWRSDSFDVQGWLIYPRDYSPQRHYPMIVSVHGGPASSRTPTWPGTFFDSTILSQEGYFVFYPNPRGSYGQGEAFTRANVKDFGHGDLRDILAGVDQVVKSYPVDADRLAILGWSYGGYMTMWTVTQTNRFRVAVAGAGICNWQSYYGQNGIDQWMIPYFGASVYDDPEVYAKSSPITFIKRTKTPTLILVGERDVECPVPQSYEFWHALKTFGVPTQLVVYANEGHGIAQPEHRRDIMKRTVSWLEKHLASQ